MISYKHTTKFYFPKLATATYLGNEDDVLAREFLFQLPDETCLDLLVRPQLGNWHQDNDGLLALDINLLHTQHKGLVQTHIIQAQHSNNVPTLKRQ